MSRVNDLKAELKQAELEEELVKQKKAKSPDAARLRSVKNDLRALRQQTREARQAEEA